MHDIIYLFTFSVNIDADSGRSTKNSGIVNDFIPNFTANIKYYVIMLLYNIFKF